MYRRPAAAAAAFLVVHSDSGFTPIYTDRQLLGTMAGFDAMCLGLLPCLDRAHKPTQMRGLAPITNLRCTTNQTRID